MVIIGCDISLNHGGFAFLNSDGIMTGCQFISDLKKDVNSEVGLFLNLKRKDDEDIESFKIRRVAEYLKLFNTRIFSLSLPYTVENYYFSIEGYAYGAVSNSVYQIAELVGPLKSAICFKGGLLRIHDPISVKFFATGKGNATKKEMLEQALKEKFLEEEMVKQIPVKYVKRKRNKVVIEDCEGPLTDVVDAYFLSRLLWTELQLREGKISLQDLPPHQIQVFNRTTKMYPVNILARPFIQ